MKRSVGKTFLLMHIALLCLSGCLPNRHRLNIKKVSLVDQHCLSAAPGRTITIWIHGTQLFKGPMQEMLSQGKPTLKSYYELSPKNRLLTIADTLIVFHPGLFKQEDFYFFGWSGRLSFQDREEAAYILRCELHNLVGSYTRKYGTRPRIRVICHSHGGNVLLKCTDFCISEPPFEIDEAVLLACPVQENTQHCIHYPGFKKIVSLYSKLDLIQIIDPQGLYRIPFKSKKLFSGRYFPHNNRLYQAKIQINGRAITHREFNKPKFLKSLGVVLEACYEEIPTQERPYERNLLTIRESW